MEEELFFVGIRDPVEIRKELLTSSKNLIDSLKRYEQYKDIKEEKLQRITELKRIFDEIMVLNKKLRNHMPKTPLRAPSTKTEKTTKASKSKPTKFGKTKIDVLEQELAKIEERLGGLE
ncbi:hypothetical protein KY309_03180 [Candidatus Woesearchaeota archaeon]|nr:hypothetical protein [Candidatus Woesearchaeota archaeon]MBW3016589.1 hypothetical protein [Candidatus Woesearchaeota archaeon]